MKPLFWATVAGLIIGGAGYFAPEVDAAQIDNSLNICAALRLGAPLADIETALLERGFNERDAGMYAGTTIRDFCPEQIPSVREQLR